MKTLIIGIDALEYDLVKKYNLKNLLQKEYGKTIVPLGKSGYPQTVQVWASFLTGKISNLQKFNTKASPLLNKLYAPLIKIKNLFPLNGKINSLGRRIFSKVNTQFPKLKEKTFIEETKADYCNIPFYDFDKLNPKNFQLARDYKNNKITTQKIYKILQKNLKKNKKQILDKLKKSKAKTFFCYFHYLDYIQHFFYEYPHLIKKSYSEFDSYIKKLKNISKAKLVIIVSDHGQKKGIHTLYGFYSLNKKLNLHFPKITDFYREIIKNK